MRSGNQRGGSVLRLVRSSRRGAAAGDGGRGGRGDQRRRRRGYAEGEVFFSGNAWPESPAAYPGDHAISNQADDRCSLEFSVYDGNESWNSPLTFDTVVPGGASDWGSGNRLLVCVAYIPDPSTPAGGLPVKYSIKWSNR